ncbi:MAG: DNA-directed polymerase subunit alpha [Patescibacteria group bacterium]|nr:DNA-directed polymerase subunit alpha [Patescibacteria group bacterium]
MMNLSIVLPSKLKIVSSDDRRGIFEIEGLYPGYGHTLGNSLRRIIYSSIPGAAITSVKIKGADHEFSTLAGVREDVMTIILNLKKVRFQIAGDEPQAATLSVKSGIVTAGDFQVPGGLVVMNPEQPIAEISGKGDLSIDIVVEKGLGFVPREMLSKEKVDVGTIMTDARFSPVVGASYDVEDMRVGDRTNYNRLRMTIDTDGSVSPKEVLELSMKIMLDQFRAILDLKEIAETKMPEPMRDIAPMSESSEPEMDKEDLTEMLKTRIDSLQLSTRTLNALSDAGIRTVGGLLQKTEEGLLDLDGFGEKGLNEVKDVLSSYGLSLKK